MSFFSLLSSYLASVTTFSFLLQHGVEFQYLKQTICPFQTGYYPQMGTYALLTTEFGILQRFPLRYLTDKETSNSSMEPLYRQEEDLVELLYLYNLHYLHSKFGISPHLGLWLT